MFKNIIIPEKIGQYYLYKKVVLSLQITSVSICGTLVVCYKNQVTVKNKMLLYLSDNSSSAMVTALKKIISTIGSYDELIVNSSTLGVIFKELKLPFLDREKLEMVIGYEVEPLLPFALNETIIDFIVTKQNHEKKESTLLIAAVKKDEVDNLKQIIQKAGIDLHSIVVDIFALYTMYQHGVYPSYEQKKIESEQKDKKRELVASGQISIIDMFIDVSFDTIRVLHIQNGMLLASRVIPYGVFDIAQLISKDRDISVYDVLQGITQKELQQQYEQDSIKYTKNIYEKIISTMSYFEQQYSNDYKKPDKILFSGIGCNLFQFIEQAKTFFVHIVEEISISKLAKNILIINHKNQLLTTEYIAPLSLSLQDKFGNSQDFLKNIHVKNNTIFYKQIFVMLLLTMLSLGATYWAMFNQYEKWNTAYLSSKKELISQIDKQMKLDVRKERSVKNIVEKVESTFKKEGKLWFAFSRKTESSYLEALQELSMVIDRESLGLELSKLYMDVDSITLSGTVKSYESLEVFEEELRELKRFEVVEMPRQLSFSVQLKIKEKGSE